MRDNFKVIIWTVVFILVIASFVVFADTLALFETNGTGEANMDIGKWVIKISDVDITSPSVQEIVIDNFTYANNVNVAPGKIAPGSSAYFDLVVDATDCDVAVKYDITFNFEEAGYASNIGFSVSQVGDNTVVQTGPNTYSGVIDLETINDEEVVTLRVNVVWNNIEALNENDTALGKELNSKLAIPVTVIAVQYLGENLTPYNNGGESNQTGN
jgi:hypothetical protein